MSPLSLTVGMKEFSSCFSRSKGFFNLFTSNKANTTRKRILGVFSFFLSKENPLYFLRKKNHNGSEYTRRVCLFKEKKKDKGDLSG